MTGEAWRAAGVALLLGVVACGSEPVALLPDAIEKIAPTDNQSAPAGGLPAQPLAVIVRAVDGTPVPRAEVRWSVTAGTGAGLIDSTTWSDGAGRAQTVVRLGPAAGTYTVRAELVAVSDRAVAFMLTATPPPLLSSATPAAFGGGDTVVLAGQNLSVDAAVQIAGYPARVVVGGTTNLTVIAPICLVPGPVAIRAVMQSAPSNDLGATYLASSAPVMLAVGDYASIDPPVVAGCAVFPAAGLATREFLMAPQAVGGTVGESTTYRFRGDSTATTVVLGPRPGGGRSLAARFHDYLREVESELAQGALAAETGGAAASSGEAAVSGLQRLFRVCSTLSCSQVEDFRPVLAEARYIGRHAVLYQDVIAPSPGLTEDDFASLGALFDQDLYAVATGAFGAESDVDGNGVISILLTPVVNGLTSKTECEESFVVGFFHPVDLDPAFQQDSRSNKSEVFYALVPDPDATIGCVHSVAQVRQLVPVTFIHEFQHMISFHQRRLLRGAQAEATWLNEAMSQLAEDLGAFYFLAQGNQAAFSDFAIGNLFNAFKYLKSPGAHATVFSGTGTLEERGAAWLFLRWLVDQFGDDLPRRLSETQLRGGANISGATGEPIERLLAQWFLANYVSDLPGFAAQPRLTYQSWEFRRVYADLHRQAPSTFDRAFPLMPDSTLGGGFQATGVLLAGSGDYLRVIQLPTQRGFSLQLTDATGGALPGAPPTRLNVVRLR